jgi:branched-chain amino acid transport system permease protein
MDTKLLALKAHANSQRVFFLCLFIAALIFPLIVRAPFLQHLLIMVFLYATIAGGWNIISGYCGQVSLGHVVFFGIGAYTSTVLLQKLGLSPWLGMWAGVGVSIFLATLIGFPCFKLRGHYFVIATWAIGEIIQTVVINWDWVGGASGLYIPILPESFVNFEFHRSRIPFYYIGLGMALGLLILNYAIAKSRLGYYFRAIKADPAAAQSAGINITKYKMIAFFLSAIPTAVAGTFYAQYLMFIDPETVFPLILSVLMTVIVVLGGVGTVWGPFLGAAVLVPLSEFTRLYIGGGGGALDMIIYGALIIVVAEYEPLGVIGLIRRLKNKW